MFRLFLFLLTFLMCLATYGQNTIGLPDVINYTKQTYSAGAQNRQIKQAKNGVLYFANNEGVLTFDGIFWKTYSLPNKSIVRSLEFGPDDLLYVGGQDELGYFIPDEIGCLIFHSLKHLIPKEERSFTDVWKICFHEKRTFFQTSNKIFEFNGNHCFIYKSSQWRFITSYNNQLIAQDYNKGLLAYKNGVWEPFLEDNALPTDYFITALLHIGKDSALLTTIKNGVFMLCGNTLTPLRSPALNYIASRFISDATLVNDQHIALTTNLDGCFIIDRKGALVQSFSRKEGLQNNNILDIFLDREKNIWLGLDNGVDFIAYNNAIKHIYPDLQNEGSGYAAIQYQNNLYLGTSSGLYKVSIHENSDLSYIKSFFKLVKNTSGQVWNLSVVNGKLLLGHHDGAFLITGDGATLIDNTAGFWTFSPFYKALPSSLMVAGTYQGINFYSYQQGGFVNTNRPAYFESARFVVIDNDTIWIAHPYKGIYQVKLDATGNPIIRQYGKQQGVKSVNGNYIFKINNQVLLTNEDGVYQYNAQTDMFEPSGYYNTVLGKKSIRYLKEDATGNIWFVFDKTMGVMDITGSKPQIIYLPELTNKFVSGFEHIYPVDKNNVFIGGEKGFFHINYEQYKKIKYPLEVQIRTVKATGKTDSLLFGGYYKSVSKWNTQLQDKDIKMDHSWNSFHFEYSAPTFAQQSTIEYSFFLKHFDAGWSEFSKKTEKEYTNLPAGTYTFQVKARNNLGNESAISSFNFTVLPPWYQTYPAYAFYIFLFTITIFLLIRHQKEKFKEQQHRYEEEQSRLQYLHQLEREKTEKEIVKLKNEKLEAEIAHQNRQLATSAMHLVQKGELLINLKEELKRLTKDVEDDKTAQNFKKIMKVLGDDDKLDEGWQQFAHHFDKVHSDFLVALKNKHPNLSANEMKLCAYLRMNLSTKEVAQLIGISVRGIEISRYRLRKKLQLATETNLFDYLLRLQTPEATIKMAADES